MKNSILVIPIGISTAILTLYEPVFSIKILLLMIFAISVFVLGMDFGKEVEEK